MAMNKLAKAAISCLLAASSSLVPLAQTVGVRMAVVGAAVLLTPSLAQAQTNKRICGSVYTAKAWNRLEGLMMEVNKADFVTCAGIIKITSSNATPTNFVQMANHIVKSWRKGWPDANRVAILRTCEAVTRDWFPPGAYNGDVCHSMQDYRLYYFESWSNKRTYLKKL